MALINCPKCGKEISDRMQTCYYCGYSIDKFKEEKIIEAGEPFSICCKCRKKVSIHLEICPHCNQKIQKKWYDDNICKINGVEYDLTPFMGLIHPENFNNFDKLKEELVRMTDCATAGAIMGQAHRNGGILSKEYNGPTLEEVRLQEEAMKMHCPRCGSTNVEEREFLPLPWASFQKYWFCKNCHSRFDV